MSEVTLQRWYECWHCEVRGYGTECWYCGTELHLKRGVGVGANPGSGNQWDRHETMEPIVPTWAYFPEQLTGPPPSD